MDDQDVAPLHIGAEAVFYFFWILYPILRELHSPERLNTIPPNYPEPPASTYAQVPLARRPTVAERNGHSNNPKT